jgi:esterase/lipase superfamily enzyme
MVRGPKKKSRKRRLIIAAGVMGLLLAGWATYEILLSPSAAIRQAEAFLFRRMTVVELEEGRYRYFYASNRQLEPGNRSIEDRVTAERGEALNFGSYDIRLSPVLGLGLNLHWSDMLQTEMINVEEIREQTEAEFAESLRGYVDGSTDRSLLVMVHGFRERFPLALRRTAFFASVLDANTPVLVFDWPADQQGLIRGYREARQVATASASELAETLRIIVNDVRPDRLAILGNSLGAQVVVDAFSLLYADPDFRDAGTEISQVFLTAPDISRARFNEQFRDEITALTDELTVYVASNDRALIVSRLLAGEARAGESTVSPDQFSEALELARLMEPEDSAINLVDVTPVNRTRNFHNFYVESPEFFDDLFLRFTTGAPPAGRRIHRVVTPEQRTYWVLTRGR